MSAQRRVYCVVDRYMTFAASGSPRSPPAATTSTATGSSAAPPRAGDGVPARAAAAQRLLPVAPAPRGDRGGRARGVAGSVRPRAAGGGRRRDLHGRGRSPSAAGSSPRRRRRRPRTSPRACSPPCAPALERAGASADGGRARSPTARPRPPTRCSEGEGARTVLVATEGFEDVVELGRQARADLYRLCKAHPAPLVPPSAASAPRADGPRRPARGRSSRRARAAVDAVGGGRARGRRRLPAARLPPPAARAALGEALAERLPTCTSRSRHEVGRHLPRVRARRDHRGRRRPLPLLRSYLRRLVERARRGRAARARGDAVLRRAGERRPTRATTPR